MLIGVVTTLVGILATALRGKNMTEKQSETLEEYYREKAEQDCNEEEDCCGDGDVQ